MILEYHRPQTLEAALDLLARPQPVTHPLGGGTVLSRPGPDQYAVVDLQSLGLNQIKQQGNALRLGAALALEQLYLSEEIFAALRTAVHREVSLNLRQMATLAGTLSTADGRSPLAAVCMALDARLVWQPGNVEIGLGDWIPVRGDRRPGKLIVEIVIPSNVKVCCEIVARTPDDLPIVTVAAAVWPSGRTRVVVGGFGKVPLLAMDGTEAGGASAAVRNAFSQADDQWASALYRQETGDVLIRRSLKMIEDL
jgi:CO/xanthine dehydrogenase FAD-binding subunit